MNHDIRQAELDNAREAMHVAPAVETNRVLRNTYLLLSLTLLLSGAMAGLAMSMGVKPLNPWITLGIYFVLLFVTAKFRNSALGLLFVFALTGFMGFTLGPIIDFYVQALSNGSQLVMMALGGTGAIFLGMSGIALVTRRDFGFLGKTLTIGILVGFVLALGALFFELNALALAVSGMFILLMAGLILYETSQIIHGGETNYIMATITLYVAIYNLFTSLLHLLGFLAGEE